MTVSQSVGQEPSFSALVQMRQRTDVDIRATWLLLPLASYLAWAAFAVIWWTGSLGLGTIQLGPLGVIYLDVSGILGLIGILGLAASAGSSFLVYTLINRINTHSARTRILLSETLSGLGSRIGSPSSPALLALNSAEVNMARFAHEERDRSAVLWALLAMIPFIGWAFLVGALWLVSRDLARHARWEGVVLEDVDRALRTAGLQGIRLANAQIRSRSGLGLAIIVLSMSEFLLSFLFGAEGALVFIYLTLGVFSLVWIDISVRDPRNHFHYHSIVENDIVQSLPIVTGASGGVG